MLPYFCKKVAWNNGLYSNNNSGTLCLLKINILIIFIKSTYKKLSSFFVNFLAVFFQLFQLARHLTTESTNRIIPKHTKLVKKLFFLILGGRGEGVGRFGPLPHPKLKKLITTISYTNINSRCFSCLL